MLNFWQNPEFVRHRRAEARPARVALVSGVVAVLYFVIALAVWSSTQYSHDRGVEFAKMMFGWFYGAPAAALCIWSFFAGLQGIARERELKTFDFLRTTRLSAGELLVGKLLGGPVLAYIIFLGTLPAAAVAAFFGGISAWQFTAGYLLALVYALFVGLIGLWLSSMSQKHQSALVVLPLLFFGYMMMMMSFDVREPSGSPVFSSLVPARALMSLYYSRSSYERVLINPLFFGHAISWVALALLVYVSFGAWLGLALVRNLKKELPEQRQLSTPQLLGFALFLNFLFYAFQNFASPRFAGYTSDAAEFFVSAIAANGFLFYAIGIAAIPSRERLRIWWRGRAGAALYGSEDGLVWPWILATAALGLVCFLVYVRGAALAAPEWPLGRCLLALAVWLVFALRDVLFLQWCTLTRMNAAVKKGVLLLAIYYVCALLITVFCQSVSPAAGHWATGVLTPFYPMSGDSNGAVLNPMIAAVGIGLQVTVSILTLRGIAGRLQRSAQLLAQAA